MHALLCCHTNNKRKNVYLPTTTISFGEFQISSWENWFVNLSCCWSHGSIAQWHLLQPVMADASERHGFGETVWSSSKSTIYFIQLSIRQSQPRLGSNPKENFFKMRQEGTWGFGNHKQLMLSLSLNTTPMMGMVHLFLNYFSPDTRWEREPPACPSKTIQHWKTKVSSPLHYPNMNRGARNHSP